MIGPGVGPMFRQWATLNLLSSVVSKLQYRGVNSEIAGGHMPNKLGSDYITVSGSAGSETYQVPNTASYISADTDYIWFKTDASPRITTTDELIGYDLPRTWIKYDNVSPYAIREILIPKAGETFTTTEMNNIRDYCQLPIFWSGVFSLNGNLKQNRPLPKKYTWLTAQSGLTLSLISGGVKIDWTDNSGGTAQTEIWGKSDSGTSALLYTINAGTVTKNDTVAPVDLRYYKIRAKYTNDYSQFTNEISIPLLSAELVNQSNWYNLTYWDVVAANWSNSGNTLVSNGGTGYITKYLQSTKGLTYKCWLTVVRTSGTVYAPEDIGTQQPVTTTTTKIYTYLATADSGGGKGHWKMYSGSFNGTITGFSMKQILMP